MAEATPKQMRIFVSHSHMDDVACHAIVAALRAAEADVWYDEHNMTSGRLGPTIERELRERPVFIVMLSPAALASRWVEDETRWAYNLMRKDLTRIMLPVLCDTRSHDTVVEPRQAAMHASRPAPHATDLLPIERVLRTLDNRRRLSYHCFHELHHHLLRQVSSALQLPRRTSPSLRPS
jgi:TIR domain